MRTSTESYEHTINGLLQKRAELMEEMAQVHERLGTLTNDIEAIDHVLTRLSGVMDRRTRSCLRWRQEKRGLGQPALWLPLPYPLRPLKCSKLPPLSPPVAIAGIIPHMVEICKLGEFATEYRASR